MRYLLLLVILSSTLPAATSPEPLKNYESRRADALRLAQSHAPQATVLLRTLIAEKPEDATLWFWLGVELGDQGRQLSPGPSRQSLMLMSRQALQRAKELQLDEPMIETGLQEIAADGTEAARRFSEQHAVNEIILQAESAFARHDYPAAIKSYRAALAREPANYAATVYLGDAYFAAGDPAAALIWFEKAAVLDPNREMAFRYAADALVRLRRKDEALDHYLSAVIAEPYKSYPRHALENACHALLIKNWIAAEHIPQINITLSEKGPQINLPPDADPRVVGYALFRAKWLTEHRTILLPPGIPSRQTLAEECAALRSLLQMQTELAANKPTPGTNTKEFAALSAALDQLAEINAAGLLEAHVLLFRANKDLAADYPAYRDQHRDELRQYLIRYYLHVR